MGVPEMSRRPFNLANSYYLFVKSDRTFLERTSQNERIHGYWHMNGHQPEITFFRSGKNTESWRIAVNEKTLRLTGLSDTNKNVEMLFNRINQFPE